MLEEGVRDSGVYVALVLFEVALLLFDSGLYVGFAGEAGKHAGAALLRWSVRVTEAVFVERNSQLLCPAGVWGCCPGDAESTTASSAHGCRWRLAKGLESTDEVLTVVLLPVQTLSARALTQVNSPPVSTVRSRVEGIYIHIRIRQSQGVQLCIIGRLHHPSTMLG